MNNLSHALEKIDDLNKYYIDLEKSAKFLISPNLALKMLDFF